MKERRNGVGLRLIDNTGKTLWTTERTLSTGTRLAIEEPMQGLPAGGYLWQAKFELEVKLIRLVKSN